MRHLLFLGSLATMLFSSCEPGQDNTSAGNSDRSEFQKVTQPANSPNRERLSAMDSVGRPPLARDLVSTIEDICPVHHRKMKLCEIPIVFGETVFEGTESASLPATSEYPFGAEKIVSPGNALLPAEPVTARVYQCISCVAARRAAEQKRTPPVPAAALK